ncbi:MAG: 50S ribosomal protein L11 methyltransferase [Thermodesulfobacteriota bacterium]
MDEQPVCLKMTISCDSALIELVTDYLVGIIGAVVEQSADSAEKPAPITAYLEGVDDQSAREALRSQLENYFHEMAQLFSVQPPALLIEEVEGRDWATAWQEFFEPFEIAEGLVIVPSWEDYRKKPGEEIIVMDPGMAFGTGQHATTALCLDLIRESLVTVPGGTLLDVGTGTGILAMAGALFGADRVIGIDNDPEAVAAAKQNVAMNNLAEQVEIRGDDLLSFSGPYELIAANIVHDVLVAMADAFYRLTRPGSRVILSGILKGDQAHNIIRVFADLGFEVVKTREKEEWAALLFSRH